MDLSQATALITAATALVAAVAGLYVQIAHLRHQINSRMDEMLALTATSSRAEGMKAQSELERPLPLFARSRPSDTDQPPA